MEQSIFCHTFFNKYLIYFKFYILWFMQDDGFVSATWNDEEDCYDTCSEEGDDYYKGVSGIPGADEYHKQFAKPNMPTHWMKMPTHP